jgi:hypothetical protein
MAPTKRHSHCQGQRFSPYNKKYLTAQENEKIHALSWIRTHNPRIQAAKTDA